MANKDFYSNNFRFWVTNDLCKIIIGFDTLAECRDYIDELVALDIKEIGWGAAKDYHIFWNKGGSLGKKVA